MIAKLVLSAGVLVAGAVVFHVTPPPPYLMVGELTAEHEGREVRVHGWVVAGSLETSCLARRYRLRHGGAEVDVYERWTETSTPIREQYELVVRGTLVDGTLEADRAAMTCPRSFRDRENLDGTFE